MIKYGLLLLTLFCALACSREVEEEAKLPENILSKEELIPLLTEISVVEGHYQMRYIQVSRYSTLLQEEIDSLFGKFNVSKEQFETSMEYYAKNSVEIEQIYQGVRTELEAQKNQIKPDTTTVTIDVDSLPKPIR